MAQVIQNDDRRLVCRVEPGKLWAGLFAAGLGIAIAAGFLHESRAAAAGLFDRAWEIGVGLAMVVAAMMLAGPEDLVLDFLTRTYRVRTGLRFLARWQEGSFEEFDRLELRKQRSRTGWVIRLVWRIAGRDPFDVASVADSGAEARDPRRQAYRLMEEYGARLSLPVVDGTGQPLAVSTHPAAGPAASTGPAPAAAPLAARPGYGASGRVGVETRRYRLTGSDGALALAKSRWFILEREGETLLWAVFAAPTLGWILLGQRKAWEFVGVGLGVLLQMAGIALPLPVRLPENGQERMLILFFAPVIAFLMWTAVLAWKTLLVSAWRVGVGETWTADLRGDCLAYNGRTVARVCEIASVEVREHRQPSSRSRRVWHQLSAILNDERRIPLAYGDYEELAAHGQGIAGFLGVEALSS